MFFLYICAFLRFESKKTIMKNYLTFLLLFVIIELFSQNTYIETFYKFKNIESVDEMKTADLDGDGDLDFILEWNYGEELYIGINNGSVKATLRLLDSNDVRYIELYDFNGDGFIDIVGTDPFDEKFYWYKNDGSANFMKNTIPFSYRSIHFADLNNDGKDEIIVGGKGLVSIMNLDNGQPTFNQVVYDKFSSGNIIGISTFDKNNDGLLEIVICYDIRDMRILEQDSEFHFVEKDIISSSYGMDNIKMLDINSDGLFDILSFGSEEEETAVFINEDNGNYIKEIIKGDFGRNKFSDFGDIDNDGDIDILFVEEESYTNGKISAFINKDGEFTQEIISDKYSKSYAGGIADLDNDSKNEIFLYTNDFFNPGILIYKIDTTSTSIDLIEMETVNVFPSLCTTDITIEFNKKYSYKVVDIEGKLIDNGIGEDQKIIDSSNWENGPYFIIINDGDNIVTKKVIKVN